MAAAQFWKYQKGEWGTFVEVEGIVELSQRTHHLYFQSNRVPDQGFLFRVVSRANQKEFLGVEPGHLLCEGLFVSRIKQTDPEAEACSVGESFEEQWVWAVRFDFVEQTPLAWNTVLYEGDGGKYLKRHQQLFQVEDMGAVLGQLDFPVQTPGLRAY